MDGNRTHPERLSSAPQTVLKTVRPAPTSTRINILDAPGLAWGQDPAGRFEPVRPVYDMFVSLSRLAKVTAGHFFQYVVPRCRAGSRSSPGPAAESDAV